MRLLEVFQLILQQLDIIISYHMYDILTGIVSDRIINQELTNGCCEKPRSWGFIEHVISLFDSPGMVKRICL